MIEAGYLQCGGLKTIVLDEADELLSRGFQESIYEIFQVLPADIQACLFSATMPPEIIALSSKFLRDPVSIRVANEDLNRLDCVQQFYVDTGEERWKLDTLLDIYAALDINQSMIFVNTKQKCDRLYADLEERDFTCQVIHGGMSQQDRNLAMLAFKSGSARILLSTGLLKRGIDIQAVNLVLNYDLPNSMEVYIHAVNRVGRYGRKGVALNFLAGQRDIQMLQDIERHYNTEIKEMPDPKEIARYM
jgi:translation initiation factor 4A